VQQAVDDWFAEGLDGRSAGTVTLNRNVLKPVPPASVTSRSAQTVYGGHEHALRQTVLALTAGSSLDEHESPGEATIQVLRGRIRLTAGEAAREGRRG
jgi:quercetin dioxygenase-like cupin family protein